MREHDNVTTMHLAHVEVISDDDRMLERREVLCDARPNEAGTDDADIPHVSPRPSPTSAVRRDFAPAALLLRRVVLASESQNHAHKSSNGESEDDSIDELHRVSAFATLTADRLRNWKNKNNNRMRISKSFHQFATKNDVDSASLSV